MRFSPVILSVIVILFGQSIAQDQTNSKGAVYGYVYNASQQTAYKKSGLAGVDVVLHRYVDGKEVEGERPHGVTDARGRFEFTGLQMGSRFGYYPATVFEGVEYYGSLVSLSPDTVRKRSDVQAFEATQSDSAVAIAMQHIVITPNQGNLQVREIYVFANRGLRTYVGGLPAGQANKKIVLLIVVPEQATDVQFGGDLMSCCAVTVGNRTYDTMAFKPGTRQILVTYTLPYEGSEAALVKEITHPTSHLDVFLPEGMGILQAAGFTPQTGFTIRGENYQRSSAQDLNKGSTVMLDIQDLPSSPMDLRWLAPVILGLLVLAGFFLRKKMKQSQQSERSATAALNPDRQRLLNEIMQLDDAFEAGSINKSTYLSTREKLKEMILAIDKQNGEDVTTENVMR